jgi:hypothetical protein
MLHKLQPHKNNKYNTASKYYTSKATIKEFLVIYLCKHVKLLTYIFQHFLYISFPFAELQLLTFQELFRYLKATTTE